MRTVFKEFFGNRIFAVAVLMGCIINFSVLEYNLRSIEKANQRNETRNGASLVYGSTVYSIDNEYYLSPVDNYLKGRGWMRSPAVSEGDYFRRVPGYSLVYVAAVKFFGYPTGHFVLRFFQYLLFLITLPMVFYLAGLFKNRAAQQVVTVVYSVVPFISGWTLYTLTESITPSLMVMYFFFLFKGYEARNHKTQYLYYLLAASAITYLALTRPYCALGGLLLAAMVAETIFRKRALRLGQAFIICLVPLLGVGTWAARNYSVAREPVFLEKAFHPQSLDRMKPEFRGLFSFAKCWGEDGAQFNQYHQPLYFAALKGDTSSAYVQRAIAFFPDEVVREFSYERLYNVLKHHQAVILQQKPYFDSVKAMPDTYFAAQLAVEKEYNSLVDEYRDRHFFGYWVKTPLVYLKRMVVHSNTANLYLFQESNRANPLINGYRYLLFVLHVSLYGALLVNIFLLKGFVPRLAFVYIPLLFVLFFTVFFREIEQRYMLPVLPVLFVGATNVFGSVLRNARQRVWFMKKFNPTA